MPARPGPNIGLTHHSQSDTLDKAREPDLIQGVQVMSIMATHIANLPSLLPRECCGKGGAEREEIDRLRRERSDAVQGFASLTTSARFAKNWSASTNPLDKLRDLQPTKKAVSSLKEFKNFALKGNVIDLAVGVIIGGAFGLIVDRWSITSSCRSSAW